MCIASRPDVARQSQLIFHACLTACLLTTLINPTLANASDVAVAPAINPPVEAPPKPAASLKLSKKNEKYDIEHIGQRGIGRGFNIYSAKREHELGRNMAASFDRLTRKINDAVVNDYINRLAQKIVRFSDAEIPFTIKVIDSGDVPRAYGLPGGFLYVDSALILSADDEAELAAVMAHEIAHVAARHATRALTRKELCRVFDTVAYMTGPAGAGIADVGGLAGPLSVKKFSRDAEYEADLLAIEYAYAAGYDPQALLDALEKLHAIEEHKKSEMAKIPGFHLASKMPFHSGIAKSFSNFPLTEERIGRLQAEISTFLPSRKDYVLDTDEFQDVKSRLLAAQSPILRHHAGDEDNKGPVLRRTTDDNGDNSNAHPLRGFAFRSE
jgi:Putative Zn-dependent protease, contains TPR repeats